MKKIRTSKLTINRETVRTLGEHQLRRAAGARRPDGSDRDNTCATCDPTMPTVCPGPFARGRL